MGFGSSVSGNENAVDMKIGGIIYRQCALHIVHIVQGIYIALSTAL